MGVAGASFGCLDQFSKGEQAGWRRGDHPRVNALFDWRGKGTLPSSATPLRRRRLQGLQVRPAMTFKISVRSSMGSAAASSGSNPIGLVRTN